MLRSVVVDGSDILVSAKKASQRSLTRLEAREAAAKAKAKREEERVQELKKVRGEKWLPSIARQMKVSFDINMYCNSLFPSHAGIFLCVIGVHIVLLFHLFFFPFTGRKGLGAAKAMNCGSMALHTLIFNSSYPGALKWPKVLCPTFDDVDMIKMDCHTVNFWSN